MFDVVCKLLGLTDFLQIRRIFNEYFSFLLSAAMPAVMLYLSIYAATTQFRSFDCFNNRLIFAAVDEIFFCFSMLGLHDTCRYIQSRNSRFLALVCVHFPQRLSINFVRKN